MQCLGCVFAGCEQLEGHGYEAAALQVGRDGVDLATVDQDATVEIAQLGLPHGSAVKRLVGHLDLDVRTALPDLQLIEDVGDGLHGVGHVAVAEVLLDGDELDAEPEQLPLGNSGVGEVPEGTRAHVDDDVIDVAVFNDALQHLLKDGPLLDCLCRVPRLHILADIHRSEGALLGDRFFALCVDAVAVCIEVRIGVHLALRADAQIADGALDMYFVFFCVTHALRLRYFSFHLLSEKFPYSGNGIFRQVELGP